MSSPATSCSRRYTDKASTYCSRNRLITIASRNDLMPRFSVYQLGRGSEPVIVVGSTVPAVAFNIGRVSYKIRTQNSQNSQKQVGSAGSAVSAFNVITEKKEMMTREFVQCQ